MITVLLLPPSERLTLVQRAHACMPFPLTLRSAHGETSTLRRYSVDTLRSVHQSGNQSVHANHAYLLHLRPNCHFDTYFPRACAGARLLSKCPRGAVLVREPQGARGARPAIRDTAQPHGAHLP